MTDRPALTDRDPLPGRRSDRLPGVSVPPPSSVQITLAQAWITPRLAWINFSGMDESDDFCPTRPKKAKLIHAARVTVLRVDRVTYMVHLIAAGSLTDGSRRRRR